MSEQELRDIWKNSSKIEQIKFDIKQLLIDLRGRMDRLDDSIRKRDRREIVASILGVVIFIFIVYDVPFMLSKIAATGIIFWFGYVIYRLSSLQNQKPAGDKHISLPFAQQLENHKDYMRKQNNLIDSVIYWYILPPYVFNILFMIGIGDVEKYEGASYIVSFLPEDMGSKIGAIVFLTIFYGLIAWMNKTSAARTYIPIIKDIERVQQELSN